MCTLIHGSFRRYLSDKCVITFYMLYYCTVQQCITGSTAYIKKAREKMQPFLRVLFGANGTFEH